MRELKKPALFIISLSFVIGILGGAVWGRKISGYLGAMGLPKGDAHAHLNLRVLTYKNLFTPEMKADLASQMTAYQNSSVEMTEVNTPEELWDRLERPSADGGFDIVTLYSYQVPLASQLGWLQPIDRKQIPLIKTIGADFTDLPGDPSLKLVLPVLWGVDGMAYIAATPDEEPESWKGVREASAYKGKVGFPNSTIVAWRLADIERQNQTTENSEEAPARKKTAKKNEPSSLSKSLQPWLSYALFSTSYLSAVPLLSEANPPTLIYASQAEMAFSPLNDKKWKFKLPEEKGTFWYLSFALGRETRDERQAYIFLNAILQKQLSERFVQSAHQASTNTELEREAIDARLKPSFLRQIPLNGFILWQDFSRAREVRGLIQDRPKIERSKVDHAGENRKGEDRKLAAPPKHRARPVSENGDEPRSSEAPAVNPAVVPPVNSAVDPKHEIKNESKKETNGEN